MTRNKPNSDRCRVIIDLSWPVGASINAGIPDFAHTSLNALFQLIGDLGLTISDKKLVPPSTQVVCLDTLDHSLPNILVYSTAPASN